MTTELLPRSRARTWVLAGCAVILIWLVVSRSFAAYLAYVAPETALRFNPWQPDALVNLADGMLNGAAGAEGLRVEPDDGPAAASQADAARNSGPANASKPDRAFSAFDLIDQRQSVDLATVRALARSGLLDAPLNPRALRILGQVADASKDDADALKLMQAATRLSLHDVIAVTWLLIKSAEAKDYETTIHYADIVLRTMPELNGYVVPVLAHIAEDKGSAGLLKAALLGNPPWRDLFLQGFPPAARDERAPLDLLLALRQTANPPNADDINRYLNFLVGHRMYSLAYYTWLQFLPLDQLRSSGLLYNGSFELAPSGSPFDWSISQGSGVSIDVEPRPDESGEHALVVNFELGRVDYHSVTQLIMLAPGPYRFAGLYKGELVGPRGLRWRVVCAENADQPLAESAMIRGRASAWTDTTLDFTVPAQGCRAQYLSLDLDSRMPSEQFVTGSIWFDDLQISRVASAPTQ